VARGPVDIGGLHLGIHYVALAALLALVGFNVLNLGVLAKTLMVQRYRGLRSRLVGLVTRRFSLEGGLVVGGGLMLAGLAIDAAILARWLANPGQPMPSTVHLAFVATTAVVLGLNLVFSSFLLKMMLDQREA